MNKDGTLYFTLTSYLVEEDFWASVEYGKGVNAEFSYTSLMCKYITKIILLYKLKYYIFFKF